jgi:hypothetical protein
MTMHGMKASRYEFGKFGKLGNCLLVLGIGL